MFAILGVAARGARHFLEALDSRALWQRRTAMRISVSSWATIDEDVDRSLDAIRGAAERVSGETLGNGCGSDT